MLRVHKRKLFMSMCIAAISAMLLPACIKDDSPIDDTPEKLNSVTVEFSIVTRSAQRTTRAVNIPDQTQVGTLAENYLDLDNLTFLFFDNARNLLQQAHPEVEAIDGTNYVKYSVKAELTHPYFTEASARTLTFQVLVLGNYSLLEPQDFVFTPGTKLDALFESDAVATFAMPIRNNWLNTWIPSINAGGDNGQQKGQIPMSGLQTYTINVTDLLASTPDAPLNLTSPDGSKDINMLRALAKIEIIDKVNLNEDGTASENYALEKAELMGYMSRGSIVPSLSQWQSNGTYETQYCKAPSVSVNSTFMSAGYVNQGLNVANEDHVLNFFNDVEAQNARADKCQVFSCYLTDYKTVASAQYPIWIRLTGQQTETESVLYRLELAPYTDGRPGAIMDIVRNNIYRYEITSISRDIEVNWTLCPMDELSTNIEFN